MMTSFKYIEKPVCFLNDKIPVLVIENKLLFRNVITSFEQMTSEDYFTFSEDYIPISFSKYGIFIADIFNVDLNNKKLLTKINTYLEENSNVEFVAELEQITKDLISFGDKLCEFADFECQFNYDINAGDIVKFLQFRLGTDLSTPIEKHISFVLLMNKYLKIKIFVIPHIHILFDKDELLLLYETLSLNHIMLLSLECINPAEKIEKENLYILDNDLCFVDNFSE